jgi:hypothetical protein
MKIIQINQLRSQALTTPTISAGSQNAAEDLLASILAFSTEDWSEAKVSFRNEWLLIARIFKAATATYCVAALQSTSALPPSPELIKTKNEEAGRLLEVLQQGIESRHVMRSLIWPLVVLGAVKIDGSNASQVFAGRELPRLAQRMGTALPFNAKGVLERFWESEKTSWDECFDQAYCFLT